MVAAIAGLLPARPASRCRRSPAAYTRAILESLAFKYRFVLDSLEELTGTPITEIRIVGGGSRNRLLNQFTADATGRTVIAGPVEATALGNIAMQMVATGAVASLDRGASDHRAVVPGRAIRAACAAIAGTRTTAAFNEYLELTCV